MSPRAIARALSPLALVWAACATSTSGPGGEPAAFAPPARSSEPGPPAAASPPQEDLDVALQGALTLEQALGLALLEHPQLEAARAAVAAAQAEARGARRLPDPMLMGRVEAVSLEGDTFDNAELLLGVIQTLPLGGRLTAAGRAADLEGEARVQDARAALLRVRRQVQGAFSAVLYAQQVHELQLELVADTEQALGVVQARQAAGDALPREALLAELELAHQQRQHQRAARLHDRARLELAAAMGLPSLSIGVVEGVLDSALELPAIEALARRIEQDPAWLAARARSEAAAARLELAEAVRIPDLNLELLYRRIESTDTDAFDLGVGVRLPLWGASRDQVLESGHVLARARASERATRAELELALRAAHQTLLGALEELEFVERELLPRAQALDRSLQVRYELGDASRAELLEGRRAWTQARLTALEARRDVLQAWATLGPYLTDAHDGAW